ncbi:sigma-70 family RNA polymerase sigma factor [Luteolibacter pohnpeiensis]|uniref:RNA polymerase sigma factor n=1 Tax=Luteolibacter pohnpeiensis TaxID=454153 RepID=A0A934S4N3_9BACT|nr:sigma-70 family RNA polymerase sigma factor [Luteolibacter pohnpeiensis]MBK1881833.1 sigma-70 family RNA polymerase sigma factor [Luteolibacter pohnpeiensis]
MPDLKHFTQVVSEHHSSLRFFILGLGVNPAWVDDVAQDAFLIAYRKWDEFETVENPGAWLRAIARNVVLNETAKINRRQRLLNENLTGLLLEADPEELSADEQMDVAARRTALRTCLKSLTDKARNVVEMRYYHDKKSHEIGELFSMKPAAVRKMLFHARQSLATCLKEKLAEAR